MHQPHSLELAQALALQAEIETGLGTKQEAISSYEDAIAILAECFVGHKRARQCQVVAHDYNLDKWQLALQVLLKS